MKKILTTLLFASALGSALAQPAALAQLEKSPRHHEWVEVKRGEHVVHTFVAYPEVKDKALAVIVIHENRGLTDWVRVVADKLAAEGYIALAPDLLSGTGPDGGRTKDFASSDAAREAIGKLAGSDVAADLNAVGDYAKTIPSANGKLAVAGFCWGGGQTWRLALTGRELVAACPFYGTPPNDTKDWGKITCPVFGFYGGNDNRVNATIEKTAAEMKAAGKTYEPVTYDGAGHAFMRLGEEDNPTPANKAAMEQAWKRLLELLAKNKA